MTLTVGDTTPYGNQAGVTSAASGLTASGRAACAVGKAARPSTTAGTATAGTRIIFRMEFSSLSMRCAHKGTVRALQAAPVIGQCTLGITFSRLAGFSSSADSPSFLLLGFCPHRVDRGSSSSDLSLLLFPSDAGRGTSPDLLRRLFSRRRNSMCGVRRARKPEH